MVGLTSEHSCCIWYQQNRTVNESEPDSTPNQTLSAIILHLVALPTSMPKRHPLPLIISIYGAWSGLAWIILAKRGLLVSIGRSVSDDETLISSGVLVLVADEAVATLADSLALHVKEGAQVLVDLHLVAVVLGVILDVPLVGTQVLHNVLLLSQLHIEVLLECLEFGVQLLIWVGHVTFLSLYSSLESFEDICLDVV